MNLGALLGLLWLREKIKTADSTLEFHTLGETCPEKGKVLKPDQVCINNQVQPRLPQ